jgi:DUF971 family protein
MMEQPVEIMLRQQLRELEIAFFDDGHDSGLYTWEYLRHLGNNQDSMWQDYLRRIKEADASRAPTR